VVIWYIFRVLVFCAKKKSGTPGDKSYLVRTMELGQYLTIIFALLTHLQKMKQKASSNNRDQFLNFSSLPGADVMILEIFSQKILAKILAFFAQSTTSFAKM
jgi:hypothetical protein